MDAGADMGGTAYAVCEAGLEEAWDAESGGGECDEEGGVRADEEVLLDVPVSCVVGLKLCAGQGR